MIIIAHASNLVDIFLRQFQQFQPLSLFSRQPPESEINFEVNTTWIRLQEHWTILKSNAMLTRLIAGIIPLS